MNPLALVFGKLRLMADAATLQFFLKPLTRARTKFRDLTWIPLTEVMGGSNSIGAKNIEDR